MADIKFAITENLGVLSEGSRGWQKEINLVSWNERKPKADIRDWGPEHEKMGKGVTLNKADLIKLKALLNELDIESLDID
ncbi:MAG: PC4/YdbC family ssDNA-binding protein [Bacillota bacterium]|nr:PC4/YdbC family ssDNA-binding protein [Bacillota bacterium]